MLNEEFTTGWRSPSNIAIIKYWGKHGEQLPDNPSLSITLSKAHTETRLTARPLENGESHGLTFHFEGKEQPAFASRIETFLERLADFAPVIRQVHISIESGNSFPHSSGIASSASAMSAVALCIADLQQISSDAASGSTDMQQVSNMARLGSGSACRSVYGPACLWGETALVTGSSNNYAVPVLEVDPVFASLRDSILIVDESVKAVSSSKGHKLMQGHPFAEARITQAGAHLHALIPALRTGDFETFGRIAEAEALALHALMMTSDPGYLLMKPNTLHILQRVRSFRESSGLQAYFTLDAGPNVHILYPEKDKEAIRKWIYGELSIFCKDGKVIEDKAGTGPERLPL